MVGIVADQELASVKTDGLRTVDGAAGGKGAGGAGGAVRAIRATGQKEGAGQAIDTQGSGQSHFLIATTETMVVGQAHRGFATSENGQGGRGRMAARAHLAGHGGKGLGHFGRFAIKGGGKQQGLVAELLGGVARSVEAFAVGADQMVVDAAEDGVAGLGGFRDVVVDALFEMMADAAGQLGGEAVFVEDFPGFGEGGGVRHGGAGADDVERVADDVGEDEGFEAGGINQVGELAALETAEMLADAVEFVNIGAAGKEQLGGGLLFLESDAVGRVRQQGGGAAGNQADDGVAGGGLTAEVSNFAGGRKAGGVGDGVGGFATEDFAQRLGMAVLGDDDAGLDLVATGVFHGAGHGGRGFASANDEEALAGKGQRAEFGQGGFVGVGGGDGGIKDGARVAAEPAFNRGGRGRGWPGRRFRHCRYPSQSYSRPGRKGAIFARRGRENVRDREPAAGGRGGQHGRRDVQRGR